MKEDLDRIERKVDELRDTISELEKVVLRLEIKWQGVVFFSTKVVPILFTIGAAVIGVVTHK